MGVPVLTRVGRTSAGRGTFSQLTQLQLPQFATGSDAAFAAQVQRLAADLPGLAALRQGLRARLQDSPLMDGVRFARSIETAYRAAWTATARAAPATGHDGQAQADRWVAGVLVALLLVEAGVGSAGCCCRGSRQIETTAAQASMRRIDLGLHGALDALRVTATDWGNWADAYRFMQDRYAGFAEENLTIVTMRGLHLTMFALIDSGGSIVWSSALEPGTEKPLRLDTISEPGLPADFPWRDSLRDGQPHDGLIATSQGVMLAAVAPILDGHSLGPQRGLMLMGRLLTAAEVAAIGRSVQTPVVIEAIRDPSGRIALPPPGGGLTDTEERTETTSDETRISRTFRDLYGNPVLRLRVDVPREISASARATIGHMVAIVAAVTVVLLVFLLLALNRMTARIELAKAEAESHAEAKSSFLAVMSHEIRTPLNVILGFAHLAMQTALNPRQLDYLGKIQHACTTLMQIVNDTLDFSKLEANLVRFEHVRFALASVLSGVDAMVGDQARRKGLQFSIEVAPGCRPSCAATRCTWSRCC